MTNPTTNPTTTKGATTVLRMIAFRDEHDTREHLLTDDRLRFTYSDNAYDHERHTWVKVEPHYSTYLACSDAFYWGSGDAEEVTEETWPLFERTWNDIKPIYDRYVEEDRQAFEARQAANAAKAADWVERHPDQTDPRYYRVGTRADGTVYRTGYGGTEEEYKPEPWNPKATRLGTTLSELYAARVRKTRPQGASYNFYPRELWDLFNEAGPERETGLGNPYKPGEYKGGAFATANREGTA